MEKKDNKPRAIKTFDADFNFFIPKIQALGKLFLHKKNEAKGGWEINLAENLAF